MRPSWDEVWMNVAHQIQRRSVDPKYKVGTIIVTFDNTQVLAVGYNGDQKGGSNVRDSLEQGMSGFIHAEENALIKCDYNNPKRKKMYVTLSPCRMCAKRIINAGIDVVIYDEEYPDRTGIELLREAGIEVIQFTLE